MLLIKIGTIVRHRGRQLFGAAGGNGDSTTSLAIFGGVFVPIGIARSSISPRSAGHRAEPATGRAGGPERDPELLPDPGARPRPSNSPNVPARALLAFRAAVRAAALGVWIAARAAGHLVRDSSHITAVLYRRASTAASRSACSAWRAPRCRPDDAAAVSIELALKARFSTAEGCFSVPGTADRQLLG